MRRKLIVEGLIALFSVACLALVLWGKQAHANINEATDAKTQFCYSYIKGLKALWYDIHLKGIERVMQEHPPADEGLDDEAALVLANEINDVKREDAQAWIEGKWATCMADPYSVRR